MNSLSPLKSAVVVGGSGAVGKLLLRSLSDAANIDITSIDVREPTDFGGDFILDSICDPSFSTIERIKNCDLLVLATSESVALVALDILKPCLNSTTLLVDTLSVKSRYFDKLHRLGFQCEAIGINPMFAPSLGFSGRSVIVVPYISNQVSGVFVDFLASQGSRIVTLSYDNHDRQCAVLQAATHSAIIAFGLALESLDYDIIVAEDFAPPPHKVMLALLARILHSEPNVYLDIQKSNPYASVARDKLYQSMALLGKLVDAENPDLFSARLTSLRRLYSSSNFDYADYCSKIFAVNN